MSKQRFWFTEPLLEGAEITLPDEESLHLCKVLRMEVGEAVEVLNGQGEIASATITESHAKRSRLKIMGIERVPTRARITLAFGLPKPPALEFIIRRATELGVAGFYPLETQHAQSYTRWNDDRWEKIVIEVAKQCREPHLPKVHTPQKLQTWLHSRNAKTPLVVCDENQRSYRPPTLATEPVDLVIGPEGGWAPEEVFQFKEAKPMFLGLGRNQLRVETASLVALTLLKVGMGELNSSD